MTVYSIHIGLDRTSQDPHCRTSCENVFNSNNGFASAFHQLKPKRREMLETPPHYKVPARPLSFPVKFTVHLQADDSSESKTVGTSNTY